MPQDPQWGVPRQRGPLTRPVTLAAPQGEQPVWAANVQQTPSAASALGKRKRQQNGSQNSNIVQYQTVPSNFARPLPSTNNPQVRATPSQRPPSLQVAVQQQHPHQHSGIPSSHQSVAGTNGGVVGNSHTLDDAFEQIRVNLPAFLGTTTATPINVTGNGQLVSPIAESTRTPTFFQQLREHATGHISADAVLPSPAASDDDPTWLSTDTEKQRRQQHNTPNNAGSSMPQNPPIQAPVPTPLQHQLQTAQNHSVSSTTSIGQTPGHSRLPPPDFFQPENCNRKIRGYLDQDRNIGRNSPAEGRINILREASMRGDLMCLALHQISCMHTVMPDQVPYAIQSLPNMKDAFAHLDSLFSRNDQLPTGFIIWAANFPSDFGHIVKTWCWGAAELVDQCKIFLFSLCTELAPLVQECKMRQYPPSPRETLKVLNVTSPVLQFVVFLFIMRSFWGCATSHWVFEAEKAFKARQDQLTQSSMLARSQIDEDERNFADQLWQYYRAHVQCLRLERRRGQSSSTTNHPNVRGSSVVQVDPNRHQQTPAASLLPRVPQSAASGSFLTPQQALSNQMNSASRPTRQILPRVPSSTIQQNTMHGPVGPPPSLAGELTAQRPGPNGHNQPQFMTMNQWPLKFPIRRPLSFFPALGEIRPQPARVDPSISALHQVHLRTPTPVRRNAPELIELGKLYQFVTEMTIRQILQPSRLIEDETFQVSEEMAKSLPRTNRNNGPLSRLLEETSHLFRFRCVKLTKPGDVSDDGLLATADTLWPENVCFCVNSTLLELRRKRQWNKHLPVDITHLIRAGENSLRVLWNVSPNYQDSNTYAAVVEIVSLQNHKSLKQKILTSQTISASSILDSIKLSLSPGNLLTTSSNDEDDGLTIVDSNIAINVFDPYVGDRLCDIPVRSRSCLHRDCFDLETFLQSRPWPRDAPQFSTVDEWRCPKCKADARPHRLIVDGFLMEVMRKLEGDGKSDTRAIVVERDGSWKPMEMASGGKKKEKSAAQIATPTVQMANVEIVDLEEE
ncbi:MAG: hypothetical protein Q9157_004346 [Trypethelium eluteriae]